MFKLLGPIVKKKFTWQTYALSRASFSINNCCHWIVWTKYFTTI